jgi:hypothetical protein
VVAGTRVVRERHFCPGLSRAGTRIKEACLNPPAEGVCRVLRTEGALTQHPASQCQAGCDPNQLGLWMKRARAVRRLGPGGWSRVQSEEAFAGPAGSGCLIDGGSGAAANKSEVRPRTA